MIPIPLSSMGTDWDNRVETLSEQLRLTPLLDLPLIALSNGQTRRARIVKALLNASELMVLEEPFTGLDPPTRELLSTLLHELHLSKAPRILLLLRPQDLVDPCLSWLTHVVELHTPSADGPRGVKRIGTHKEVLALWKGEKARNVVQGDQKMGKVEGGEERKPLVEMESVNITYGGTRQVLKDINWAIKAGDRIWLQGSNGSGKTTLLSL